jgi:hypothetical protein
MSKQTAVEWLINVLDIDANDSATKEAINQAKAMEKEQLENAYFNGGADNMNDEGSFKEYYIETYGGDE